MLFIAADLDSGMDFFHFGTERTKIWPQIWNRGPSPGLVETVAFESKIYRVERTKFVPQTKISISFRMIKPARLEKTMLKHWRALFLVNLWHAGPFVWTNQQPTGHRPNSRLTNTRETRFSRPIACRDQGVVSGWRLLLTEQCSASFNGNKMFSINVVYISQDF